MTLTLQSPTPTRPSNSNERLPTPTPTVTLRLVTHAALAHAQQAELRQVAATIPTDTAQQGVQQTCRAAG